MAPSTTPSGDSTAVGAAPGKGDTDTLERAEIERVWMQVQEKVIQLAGGDPKIVLRTLDTDGVLKYLDSVQTAEQKKSDKFAWFRGVVHKTLQCITTVGGIVTDGVSEVFAPAQMCYNALTFVIQAWQGYEGMFENLAELLEKCVEFLERLDYYKGSMDLRLARLACQNLQLFVEICDRTIRLRKKHNRFLAFTKQLFLNDNGIQGLLSIMERLNGKETLLVNAQTYKLVSDSAGDIKLILDGQKERGKDDQVKRWRSIITKALSFPDTALGTDGEPIPTWQRTLDARKNKLVDETGKWILKEEAFLEWTKPANPSKPILVLEGRSGSGKTAMMANVLKYLRGQAHMSATSRIVSAYFIPDTDSRKSDEDDEEDIIGVLSRTLLWQLSTAYEKMTKSVAQISEGFSEFDSSLHLWQQLFVGNKERINSETIFYLFIDGVDDTIQRLIPLLQELVGLAGAKRTRILLSARPRTVTEWLSQTKGLEFDTIKISNRNDDDIAKYITHRMDQMPIFKDPSRPGIAGWRETVLTTLSFKCDGDYFKLNTSLADLAKVDLVEDIREVLDNADKTRSDQIDAEIQRLNNMRTPKEIQEINEIITWVDCGRQLFSVETMDALLSIKHRTGSGIPSLTAPVPMTRRISGSTEVVSSIAASAPATLTISLLPFAQKLVEKYPIFTITDSGFVDWRASEIKSRVPLGSDGVDRPLIDIPTMGPQAIGKDEINIVRHFLTNVCPPDLYRRFEFEQFFEAKSGARNRVYIHLDPDNAELRITLASLTILTDEVLRHNWDLRRYAMYWLLTHMHKVDLSAADRELKSQVGPLLVRLFTEPCGIDSMFWSFNLDNSMRLWRQGEHKYLREARAEWVYSAEGVQEIVRWFQDSSVTRRIVDEKGISFVAAVRSPGANLHRAVLSIAAKQMAHHLYCRKEFTKREYLAACCFIRGFLARLDTNQSNKMQDKAIAYTEKGAEGYEIFEFDGLTMAQVDQIEAWAIAELKPANFTASEKSLWEFSAALVTFHLCPSEDRSNEPHHSRARKALKLDPRNWHACHFIADRRDTSDAEAIELLSRTKHEIDVLRASDPTWLDSHANSSLLARVAVELGHRLWAAGNDYDLAARTHQESLQFDYAHFRDYAYVLVRYQKREAWPQCIAFLETINSATEKWAPFLDDLVNEFLADPIITEDKILAQAANATGRWDVVETFFTAGIELGIKQKEHDIVFLVRSAFASTLDESPDNAQRDKIAAIRAAALEDIKMYPSNELSQGVIQTMSDSLAQIYREEIFRPNQTPDSVESYIALLTGLIRDTDDVYSIPRNIVPACSLILYHHKSGIASATADYWKRRLFRTAFEFLSDDDGGNDGRAYWILDHLLTTLGDEENARITRATENMMQYDAQMQWEKWTAQKDIVVSKPVVDLRVSSDTPESNRVHTQQAASETGITMNGQTETSAADPPASEVALHKKPGSDIPILEQGSSQSIESPSGSEVGNDALPTPSIGRTPSEGQSNHVPPEPPMQPSWFTGCDACDKEWVYMTVPLYTCINCVGEVQLDEECYERFMKGELRLQSGVQCKREHTFFVLPQWNPPPKKIPGGCVFLPDAKGDEPHWMTSEDWIKRLKSLYLDGECKDAGAK